MPVAALHSRSIWNWQEAFEPLPADRQITLGEANTPLVRSRRIGPAAGLPQLWFKLDLCNPTGSYKDRFAAVAVSHLAARGGTRCLATSSGNAGASLAAYCAAAGIRCEVAVSEAAPAAKLQQMLAYNASIFRVRGFGPDPEITARVFRALERLAARPDSALLISAFRFCAVGMGGVRSLAYELAAELPDVAHVFCQAGGGGLVLAVAQGFLQLRQAGRLARIPAVQCVQPLGNDTISSPIRAGHDRARAVDCTAKISGLQVASVVDGDQVIPAVRATGGTGHVVPDEETWRMQERLAEEEGIFCEPAAAITVAAVLRAAAEGIIRGEEPVVATLTGSGFKDPASVERMTLARPCPMCDVTELEERAEGDH